MRIKTALIKLLHLKSWKDLGRLPRPLWFLSFAALINRMGTMAVPFLVLYLTQQEKLSAERAAFALALYGAGAMLGSLFSGWLCDRWHPLRVMQSSLLMSSIFLLSFPSVHGHALIYAVTFVWGLVTESYRPASMVLVSDIAPAPQRKQAFVLYRLAINLGMSIGPAIGGFLAEVSFRSIFVVDGIFTFGTFLIMIFGMRETAAKKTAATSSEEKSRRNGFVTALSDLRYMAFLAGVTFIGIVFFQHESSMPLFMVNDLRLLPSVYGMMFTINAAMIVFLEVPVNAATEHWSYRKTLIVGAMLFAIGNGALLFVSSGLGVALTVAIWTVGEMIFFPSSAAYISEMAPSRNRGQYMALFNLSFSFASMFGRWAGTLVLVQLGANALWIGVFLLGCIASAIFARTQAARTASSG
ncbi:MAG: MFS transporter [Bdellovibrionota bacterium]